MSNLSIAQRNYDRQLPEDLGALSDLIDDTDWTPNAPMLVTEAEIDALIEQIADTGFYDDELGNPVAASKVHRALANVWMDGPMNIYGEIYTAFRDWAAAIAKLAKFGK